VALGLREKYSSAVLVLVCCSPDRSTPCFARNARVSAATSNAPVGVGGAMAGLAFRGDGARGRSEPPAAVR
jgi:hypothetical protein